MKIYHGSKVLIEHPTIKGSDERNDYGPSFYLTKDLDAAKSWACKNNSVGVVNEYEIKKTLFDKLKILDLTNKSKYSVLNWMAILMHFRELDSSFVKKNQLTLNWLQKYYVNVDDYDVVIGFRADDAYFRFPLDFVRGNLTLEQLDYSFQLGKLGIQYVLISDKSFKHLKYIKSITSDESYIEKYFYSVKRATEQFDNLSKDEEGTRIIDIMRGNRQ